MRNRRFAVGSFLAFFLLVVGSASAHHAWGGYDMANMSTINGTVQQFDWANPHVWIKIDVKDANGNIEKWNAGGPSPNRMANTGWDKDTLRPGDRITAVGNRIKDGTFNLRLAKVVLSDGRELICYGGHYGA